MMTEPYLTTEQLAARWGVKPSTIKGQRARGSGPRYVTLPRLYASRHATGAVSTG